MASLKNTLLNTGSSWIGILDGTLGRNDYLPMDLSVDNVELEGLDICNPSVCQDYIDKILKEKQARVAYGGYLERRKLYGKNTKFSDRNGRLRNIHLGMDFWAEAHTTVLVPLDGKVHSFGNNKTPGDYGPTIVLAHQIGEVHFYSLYGHLSLDSLHGLFVGKKYCKGDVLAGLGTTEINVNYAPHLHFQIIGDIGNYIGDYPGVCYDSELDFYSKNCPDPNLLLKF